MEDGPLSVAWLSRWRSEIGSALRTLTSAFEEKYGYPAGANQIRTPDAADLAAASDLAGEPLTPDDLATFYRSIGEVQLEDVGNAYFIHPADLVLAQLRTDGPIRLSDTNDAPGMVIASDGGGILFAVDTIGSVYRSSAASTDSDFVKVADSLREFLDLIHRSTIRFIDTGQPGYL
jgi:hypothetical protein